MRPKEYVPSCSWPAHAGAPANAVWSAKLPASRTGVALVSGWSSRNVRRARHPPICMAAPNCKQQQGGLCGSRCLPGELCRGLRALPHRLLATAASLGLSAGPISSRIDSGNSSTHSLQLRSCSRNVSQTHSPGSSSSPPIAARNFVRLTWFQTRIEPNDAARSRSSTWQE